MGEARRQQLDADYNRFWELKLARQTTFLGAELFAGRRQGNGTYATYAGKSATTAVGEMFAGLEIPLLRDRAMDRPRLELGLAHLEVRRKELDRQQKGLDVLLKAGAAYWKWVLAGHKLLIQRDWVATATKRQDWLFRKVSAGDTARIKLVDAHRALAQGKAKLADNEREFAQARAELVLYTPDAVADENALPPEVPQGRYGGIQPENREALPQFRLLSLEQEVLQQRRDYARALTLPDLRVGVEAARDLGGPAAGRSDDDQLRMALRLEVPLENRKGDGARQEISAELAALHHERRWLENAWEARRGQNEIAWRQIDSQLNWIRQELADTEQMRAAEARRLEQGDSDIFFLIIRELDLVKARQALLETQTLRALTALEASALDGSLTTHTTPEANP